MAEPNPVGRPSNYDESFPEKVREYLLTCTDKEYEFQSTRGEKSDSFQEKIRTKLPTMAGLARFLGVNRSTLYEWKKDHEEFSDSLDELLAEQEERLLNGGLSGTYNPTISKLVLSSNHGYKEREDHTTNDKDLPQPIMKVGEDNPDVG